MALVGGLLAAAASHLAAEEIQTGFQERVFRDERGTHSKQELNSSR